MHHTQFCNIVTSPSLCERNDESKIVTNAMSHAMWIVCMCSVASILSDFFYHMDYSLPGSSVQEILQARILERVVMPSSRRSSWSWHWTCISCIAGGFLTHWAIWEAHIWIVILLNSWYSSLDLFIIFAYLYHVLLIIFISPKIH